VESFDARAHGQLEGGTTKERHAHSLFVFEEELYAVGGNSYGGRTTIERPRSNGKRSPIAAKIDMHVLQRS